MKTFRIILWFLLVLNVAFFVYGLYASLWSLIGVNGLATVIVGNALFQTRVSG
jgi:hypothetical protein